MRYPNQLIRANHEQAGQDALMLLRQEQAVRDSRAYHELGAQSAAMNLLRGQIDDKRRLNFYGRGSYANVRDSLRF